MNRYFLDTHIVAWLLDNNLKLDENLKFDIQYPSGNQYVTSEIVLLELMHIKQLGRISVAGTAIELINALESMNVGLEFMSTEVFTVLEKIPVLTISGARHTDMRDRVIIASCIANSEVLISHDMKFPHYRQFGLKLLEA